MKKTTFIAFFLFLTSMLPVQKLDQLFFLYLVHTIQHTKLAVSDEFNGKSAGGIYGDVIEEINYHVGRIKGKLKNRPHLDSYTT
ncbi:MAG: hypothetical protein MI866_02030 [Bacteroidales bacterium]|nr:hypothetical protein [Bacteroidales bacterium]